jgi:hemoglobin-like flavoprotein
MESQKMKFTSMLASVIGLIERQSMFTSIIEDLGRRHARYGIAETDYDAVGQALITTAWSVGFGLTMLATQIGWKQTRGLIHVKKKKDGDDDPLAEGTAASATG